MKGLLRKDLYQIWAQMKVMYTVVLVVLIIWAFSVSDSYAFPISYAVIFLGILPVSLLSYDQTSGWVEYSLTLPVSKKTLVAEKYLVGLLCAAGSVAVGVLFIGLLSLHTRKAMDDSMLFLVANGVNTILLINSICLPLMYRFGAEKARMIYILTFAGIGGLMMGGGMLLEESQGENALRRFLNMSMPIWAAVAVVIAALVLYAASWRVSIAWYGKYKK